MTEKQTDAPLAPLNADMDGHRWAKEFMRMWGGRLGEVNEGLMISWFCNAIMAGYDNARWKAEAAQRSEIAPPHSDRAALRREAALAYESHAHVAGGLNPDKCQVCGTDIRDEIHLRYGETRQGRINDLFMVPESAPAPNSNDERKP